MTPLARARALVERVVSSDPAQDGMRTRILHFMDAHGDALHRSCAEGHLTASALVVDQTGERVLLMLHRKLGMWLQMGGHADGDPDLARVALREAREESGIEGLRLSGPIDLDVHLVRPPGEPPHLHLDVRYLAVAPPAAAARANSESVEVRWFSSEELAFLDLDESTRRLIRVAVAVSADAADSAANPHPR